MVDKKKDFNYFLEQLKNATAKIDSQFFKLSRAGYCEEQIFRERVYCYELYHQLRYTIDDNFPYQLNGEVDKRGHSFIKGEFKPDFIVHIPGDMKNNLAVIEVKPTNAEKVKIKEDIDKFKVFLEADYYKAIMLIYGDDKSKVDYAQFEIAQSPQSVDILLLWHKEPRSKAEVI